MTNYTYSWPWLVVDRGTGQPMANISGGQFYDSNMVLQSITTLAGVPTTIQTGPTGLVSPFIATVRRGIVRVNGIDTLMISDEAMTAGDDAIAARAAAEAAQVAAEAAVTKAAAVSNIYLGPDGSVYYSSEPVSNGGGILAQDGTHIYAVFP